MHVRSLLKNLSILGRLPDSFHLCARLRALGDNECEGVSDVVARALEAAPVQKSHPHEEEGEDDARLALYLRRANEDKRMSRFFTLWKIRFL